MRYFMIRHRETGQWLPHATRRNATSATLTTRDPPRLFRTRAGAQQALKWWAEGVAYLAAPAYDPEQLGAEPVLTQDNRERRQKDVMDMLAVTVVPSKEG